MTAIATAPLPAAREMRAVDQRQYSFAELREIAQAFAQSGFFKDGRTVEACLTKILAGQELGLPPMQAMTQIMMVDGRPTLAAPNVGAMVKRSRRYDYRVVALTDVRCELEFLEYGQVAGPSIFLWEHAIQAGLASKDVWKKYPRNMLFSRAMTNGARWYAAEAFNGAIYTPEELGAEVEVTGDGDMRLKNITPPSNGQIVNVPAPPQPPAPPPAAPANGHATTTIEAVAEVSPFAEAAPVAPAPAPEAEQAAPDMDALKSFFNDARFPREDLTLGKWLVKNIASCSDLQERVQANIGLTEAEYREAGALLEAILKRAYEEYRLSQSVVQRRPEPAPVEDAPAAQAPAVVDEYTAPSTKSQRAQIAMKRKALCDRNGWTLGNYRAFMAATFEHLTPQPRSATQLTIEQAKVWSRTIDHALAEKQEPWPDDGIGGDEGDQ